MNDIRRTILWVIFGFSMVLLWDQWQIYNGHKPTFFPTPPKVEATAPTAAGTTPAANGSSVPAAAPVAGQVTSVPGSAQANTAAPRELIEVRTDVLKLSFDSEGASLVRTEFLKHEDAHRQGANVVLLDESKERVYLAQTGLIAGPAGGHFPTHKTAMRVLAGERTLKDGQDSMSLQFESLAVDGVKLLKTYTFKRGAYDMGVKHEVVNGSNAPVAPQLYLQLVRDGNKPEGESSFYSTFTGPAVYTGAKKYQKFEFTDIEKGKAEFVKQSNNV